MQVVERDQHRALRRHLAEPAQRAIEAGRLTAGACQLADVLDGVATERDDRLAEQPEREPALHRAGDGVRDREAALLRERRSPPEQRGLADPRRADQQHDTALAAGAGALGEPDV